MIKRKLLQSVCDVIPTSTDEIAERIHPLIAPDLLFQVGQLFNSPMAALTKFTFLTNEFHKTSNTIIVLRPESEGLMKQLLRLDIRPWLK